MVKSSVTVLDSIGVCLPGAHHRPRHPDRREGSPREALVHDSVVCVAKRGFAGGCFAPLNMTEGDDGCDNARAVRHSPDGPLRA